MSVFNNITHPLFKSDTNKKENDKNTWEGVGWGGGQGLQPRLRQPPSPNGSYATARALYSASRGARQSTLFSIVDTSEEHN